MAHGARPWIAEEVAKAVAVAESKGNIICGLYYLESYCQQLLSGRVKGTVEPEISLPKPAAVYADAKFGFAQAAFSKALPRAIACVQEQGICSLAVAHAHTCTSLGYFTEQIAQSGYIAIGFTNASAVVSPPNGRTAVLGTNPIAMAIPAQGGGVAFQFDQSTSTIALGKIAMAKAAGSKIPLGWAIDKDGNATDDPEVTLQGSLLLSGGHKGWGFALMSLDSNHPMESRMTLVSIICCLIPKCMQAMIFGSGWRESPKQLPSKLKRDYLEQALCRRTRCKYIKQFGSSL